MPDPTDLTEQIDRVAQGVASISAPDGRSGTEHPLPDLIQVDQHNATKRALAGTNPSGGPVSAWGAAVRPARVVPPGAV